MVSVATILTAVSGNSHCGKKGCITYLANVSPMIAFVVGLKVIRILFLRIKN